MPTSFINDPEHWLDRAKEARTLADQMNDEGAKHNASDRGRLRAACRALGGTSKRRQAVNSARAGLGRP